MPYIIDLQKSYDDCQIYNEEDQKGEKSQKNNPEPPELFTLKLEDVWIQIMPSSSEELQRIIQ